MYGRNGVDGLLRDSTCRQTGGGTAIGLIWGGPASTRGQLRNVTAVSLAPGGVGISLRGTGNGAAEIDAVNTIVRGGLTDVVATTTGPLAPATTWHARHRDPRGSESRHDPGRTARSSGPYVVNAAAADVSRADIDAGIADPLLGPLDFEGQARVIGPAPDIGADEFMPAPPPATPSPPKAPKKKCKKHKKKHRSAESAKKKCKKKKKKKK